MDDVGIALNDLFVAPSVVRWADSYHQWKRGAEARHQETDLPEALGPFALTNRNLHTFDLIDCWRIVFTTPRGQTKYVGSQHADIFDAFLEMVALHRAWLPTRPKPQVYFIGTELREGKPVKIGTSSSPKDRLATLQTSHPHRLQIFATVDGGPEVEAKYHMRWRARRMKGEWFTLGECIIKEIERIRAA